MVFTACLGMAFFFILRLERFNTLGQFDDCRLGATGLNKARQKAFEPETIDQNDIGTRERCGIRRLRLIDMAVAVRANKIDQEILSPPTFLAKSSIIEKLDTTFNSAANADEYPAPSNSITFKAVASLSALRMGSLLY